MGGWIAIIVSSGAVPVSLASGMVPLTPPHGGILPFAGILLLGAGSVFTISVFSTEAIQKAHVGWARLFGAVVLCVMFLVAVFGLAKDLHIMP